MTPSRRAVVDAVERRTGRFTVVEIFDSARRKHPPLGLATTYRTIELLRRAGAVHPLGTATYVRCKPGHHHHLVCTECGGVEETDLCAVPPDEELRRRHGFHAESHELDIYGTCARCSA